jgi:hypothetical protein
MCVGSDIIASITVSPTIKAVILYVETFKTDVNVHFGKVMCHVFDTSHWLIFFSIIVSPLILSISLTEMKG